MNEPQPTIPAWDSMKKASLEDRIINASSNTMKTKAERELRLRESVRVRGFRPQSNQEKQGIFYGH